MSSASVRLWGRTIGAVAWDAAREIGFFEYAPAFRRSNIQVAPLTMPLSPDIYSFPELATGTFHGLPGMLADSLPDRFGTALVNAWLATRGRSEGSFNPVERLCYTGQRGMGALEFEPAQGPPGTTSKRLDLDALAALAAEILSQRERFRVSINDDGGGQSQALLDILRVGTSAGGARAKAVITWNPTTHEVRSGQVQAPAGFSHWLLKFDGVAGSQDENLDTAAGFGLIEYAYHRMAVAAGIEMPECRILKEEHSDRRHFMARRFDRGPDGAKLHMLSLCGLAHYDFNQAGAHSYEQALRVMQRLELPMRSREEQFRRMVFNVVARNQDDHAKNIAFLMDRSGCWSLAPAYDLTYSFNPSGLWTARHRLSLNGKRDLFTVADLVACARSASMKRGRAEEILNQVREAVRGWTTFAEQADVAEDRAVAIAAAHRLAIDDGGRLRSSTEG